MNSDEAVRKHVIALLDGAQAHMTYDDVVADFPENLINVNPPNVVYTPWHLIEHLRITQWDILEYVRDPKHVSPDWPAGYWPESPEPPSTKAWEKSLKTFARDLASMKKLVVNPKTDLFARIPHGTGQTILREALLVADHNAYHLGQVIVLCRLLGAWKRS